jgi:hypothetical protein
MAAHYRAFAPAGFAGYERVAARRSSAIMGRIANACEPANQDATAGNHRTFLCDISY